MATTILVRLAAGTLPLPCYPTNQDLYEAMVEQTTAELTTEPTGLLYNLGDSTPSPDNRIWPWFRTVGGVPDDWYYYVLSAGFWLSEYKRAPAGPNGLRVGWVGDEADLPTYDGGEKSVVGDYSGPFWEVDHLFDGRSPMAPGNIPDATPVKALSPREIYGEGSHLQTEQELAQHSHPLVTEASITNSDGSIKVVNTGGGGPGLQIGLTGVATTPLSVGQNNYATTQQKIPVIHPVYGMFQIKRTQRIWKRAAP